MITRIKTFIRDIRAEWDKVSKPDRKEVQGNTLVVIVACAILGLFLWLVDGNTEYPGWVSIHGIILLIAIIVCVTVIAKTLDAEMAGCILSFPDPTDSCRDCLFWAQLLYRRIRVRAVTQLVHSDRLIRR